MKQMTWSNKEYKPAVVLDALLDAGIAFEDIDVFGDGPDFNLMVTIYASDADETIEQTVRDVVAAHDASEISNAERLQDARGQIRDLRDVARNYADDVARNYADDVAALYAAVIAADAAGDTAGERSDRIRQVMADADAAFRTRFSLALAGETGIDLNGQGLSNLTPSEIQALNGFARGFANSLAMLLAM